MTKYYKFLTDQNTGEYSDFDYTDYLPSGSKPGKWLPKVEKIELCERGYHACKRADVVDWMNAQMFEVELRGDRLDGATKVVAQEMRLVRKIAAWNDRTARLAACDIAETVIHLWNEKYPNDNRPQICIDTARAFANGNATKEEMAAARDAARDAARAAAGAAALTAAKDVAWTAARAAAWTAARAAAGAAAWAAAWDVNKKIIYKYMGI